ncbi:3-oxoadipate enol-lactonase [Amycolatopsis marina]|uniref:3-oxoadipate enol-lactonase n=1 Tax=Amycolatopsis marina TaxID=490629 RepID=A0A1I0ZK57_9PSEU|nr:alpha/beta fold hydrolase [Amycolatopsis marina]SFB26149.1 3-oxoadipate enol-lactonase [Amycolatopsis marina]
MNGFPEVHRPETDVGRPLVLLHGGNVANWMWEPQLAVLTDRLVLTPDLPGFGERVREDWPGLDAVADDVVARVTARGVDGPFDLVGLSLGAVTAVRVLARHPDRVRSAFLTGAPLVRPGAGVRVVARLQLALWGMPWFWRTLAAAMRLPEDSRERYVTHGLSVSRETASAMFADVYAGGVPAGAGDYSGPLLAIAGEKEDAAVRRSLKVLAQVAPQAQLRFASGMHHVWNIEDVSLFNEVLCSWLNGTTDARLVPLSRD